MTETKPSLFQVIRDWYGVPANTPIVWQTRDGKFVEDCYFGVMPDQETGGHVIAIGGANVNRRPVLKQGGTNPDAVGPHLS